MGDLARSRSPSSVSFLPIPQCKIVYSLRACCIAGPVQGTWYTVLNKTDMVLKMGLSTCNIRKDLRSGLGKTGINWPVRSIGFMLLS